ncbi:glycosyltransferase family 20-domain-containing protein [Infundibulicybe gibba]|nr:glycosyltransferase family 20-domain-containing protein [Infundibulicybe gibba]
MSSFRHHRVVIASLFLPSTAILGESGPPTPEKAQPAQQPLSLPAVTIRLGEKSKHGRHSRQSSTNVPVGSISGPLKSIVEDLKDKTRNPTPAALRSPTQESINPFSKLTKLNTTDLPENGESTPPTATRKYQTTHTDYSPRIQRKQSRSSSRRAADSSDAHRGGSGDPWHIEPNPHCNGGLKNAVLSVGDKLKKRLWVGTLGTSTDKISDGLRRNIDRRMMLQKSSLPVWIPDAEFESCYDEFCHQVLWPCLHYAVPDAPKTKLFYESASYKQYVAVNQRFADAIIANYKEGDITSSILPTYSTQTPIGFFMHVAFPSSEIFRCLSVRQDLLKGLLGADLVGFQTASYARHFRQTVSRILTYEALPKGIQIAEGDGKDTGRGRFVDVGVFPMGIDVGQLRLKKQEPEVAEWVQVLKQRYLGMKLVVGRDKLDEIQGVRQKIQAFETFLEKYPEFQQKVVLIQVALQTTESNELAGGVADVVSRINSRYSTLTYQPVVFLHTQDLTFNQYLALLTVADAFIVTSLREGMALRTHEYFKPLILSEFAGSYSYSGFRSCIPINPWDTRGTAYAIHQALTMSKEESVSRWEDLHNHVITQTAQTFVTSFLTRCLRAHTEHVQGDLTDMLPRYRHSQKRLILLDFEGTLWLRDASRQGISEVPEDAIDILKKLADDRRNEVCKFRRSAENGCFIKTRPTRGSASTGEWISVVSNFNLTWKSACLEILNYVTDPWSFVEEREASIIWRFWTGGGGRNSFLVLPNNISRSTAVGSILHPGGPARSPISGRAIWMSPEVEESVGTDLDFLLATVNEFDHAETCSTIDPIKAKSTLALFAGMS